jgi:hypothetical protein
LTGRFRVRHAAPGRAPASAPTGARGRRIHGASAASESASGRPFARRPLIAGISDQRPATFADPRYRSLGLRTARLVVPYDVMATEPATVAAWMSAAAGAGVDEPFVAFGHAKGDQCPEAPCRLPTVAAYAAGVRAFLAAYPQVRLVTPWNEANHVAEPTARRPDRAAAYYDAARAVCRACTLVAADVIDGPGMVAWLRAYRAALREAPPVWGLHDYYDTTYRRTSGLRDMLATVDGDVWLTETGGIVELRDRDGIVRLPLSEARATAAVRLAIRTARRYAARVPRLYVYHWRADAGDRFDAGLVGPDGRARPALGVVRRHLARRTAPSGRARARARCSRVLVNGRPPGPP